MWDVSARGLEDQQITVLAVLRRKACRNDPDDLSKGTESTKSRRNSVTQETLRGGAALQSSCSNFQARIWQEDGRRALEIPFKMESREILAQLRQSRGRDNCDLECSLPIGLGLVRPHGIPQRPAGFIYQPAYSAACLFSAVIRISNCISFSEDPPSSVLSQRRNSSRCLQVIPSSCQTELSLL